MRSIASILMPALVALAAGCVSLEDAAPPVAAPLLLASPGASRSELESGRRLYLGECARCHAVEPIRDYGTEAWRAILADMAARTALTPEEERAVTAYVLGARALVGP